MHKVWLYGLGVALGLALVNTPSWAASCGNTAGGGGTKVSCKCGDTAVTNVSGSHAIFGAICAADGLFVGANNITIDCGSRSIRGDSSGLDTGVDISSHSGVTVKNCNVLGFANGFDIDDSSDITLTSVKSKSNTWNGVHALNTDDLTIKQSAMQYNSGEGLSFDNVTSSNISGNRLEFNDDGLTCTGGCVDNTFATNQVNNNSFDGIELEREDVLNNTGNQILNNVITGHCPTCGDDEGNGIVIEDCATGNTVSGNRTTGNKTGISLESCSGSNTVSGNITQTNTANGILISSGGNSVSGNTGQTNGGNGLAVPGGSNTVTDNIFNYNAGHGICADPSNTDGGGNTGTGNATPPNVTFAGC